MEISQLDSGFQEARGEVYPRGKKKAWPTCPKYQTKASIGVGTTFLQQTAQHYRCGLIKYGQIWTMLLETFNKIFILLIQLI